MKKIVFFAAIVAVILSACSTKSGRMEKSIIIKKVTDLSIDSCQYDRWGNVFYFAGGDTAVKIEYFSIIVGYEDISLTQTPEIVGEVRKILAEKWPAPEKYIDMSLRHFKQVIMSQPLDSISFRGYSGEYYDFYLRSYKISITVLPDNDMWVSATSTSGEYIDEFCSIVTNWSYEQQQEILQLLLTKEEEKK